MVIPLSTRPGSRFGLSILCTRGQAASDDAKTTPPFQTRPPPTPPKLTSHWMALSARRGIPCGKDGWLAGCTVCTTQPTDGIGQSPCKLLPFLWTSRTGGDSACMNCHTLPGIAVAEAAEHPRAHGTDPSARATSTARRYGEILHRPRPLRGPAVTGQAVMTR